MNQDPTRWLTQLSQIFGTNDAYVRQPDQLFEARSEDEHYRRAGAAERKRQRRRDRNLAIARRQAQQ